MDEDFASMMNGYKNGVITDERLDDALHRILALKPPHWGLKKVHGQSLFPPPPRWKRVGCAAHRAMQKEISEHALTLVKIQGRGRAAQTAGKAQAHHDRVRVTGLEAMGLAAR